MTSDVVKLSVTQFHAKERKGNVGYIANLIYADVDEVQLGRALEQC